MEMPKHIAISLDDISDWCRDKSMGIEECCSRCFGLVSRLLAAQISSNIPIFTIYLLPEDVKTSTEDYMIFCDCMANFFSELAGSSIVSGHKIKISIFGKWYNLPGKAVESLKMAIEATKEYDSFFANFCINYDGQEEILDAMKLVIRQVLAEKVSPENLTKEDSRVIDSLKGFHDTLRGPVWPPPARTARLPVNSGNGRDQHF